MRNDASCDRVKGIKAFLHEKHMKSIIWLVNSLNINPIWHSWWNVFKMGYEKTTFMKEDLLTAIRKSRNHIEKEYYFELGKSMMERISAVVKARGGTIRY